MNIQFDDSVVSLLKWVKSKLFQVVGSHTHNEELSDIRATTKYFKDVG